MDAKVSPVSRPDLARQASSLGDGQPRPSLSRRASFSSRATTFKFSAALEAAGAKPEEGFNLDQWRLQVKKFFSHSRFGRYYENVLIILSLVSCIEYIYETYLHPSDPADQSQLEALKDLELGFAAIFGLDWLLSFFLAEHRLLFFLSFYSIVDLMTVIPFFITYASELPNVNYIRTFREAGLYAAFAMNTTRILRALRIRHKLAKIQDAVERFLGELVLSVIVMILFFASVMQFLEFTYQPHAYHTWMYYIWVTISTVGYGDISPMSTQGRIAVMCIIGFSIISIPKMTNELIEKMALQSVYMRNAYTPKSQNSKHVVICGDLSSTSLEEFFEELFHEDHENTDLNAILLLPTPPTTEMIFLLRDSSYFLNLLYLEGSALIDKDLKRAKAHTAMAIFIMTNKFSEKPDEEDAKSILLNLSIKRYVMSFKLPPKLFCLQLIRPQNRRHLARDEADEVSAQDLVVCLNEIKMGVLAKAVMYPGANTLLMNLISSFSDDPVEAGENEEEQIPVTSDTGNKVIEQVSAKAWVEEYQKGCDWEIYTTPLAKIFEGAKFCELAFALYDKIGVVLFALQITDAKVQGASKLLLNPANFIIPSQDLFTIEAFVIAQNKASSDLSFNNVKVDATQQALRNIEAGFQSLSRVNRNITSLGGLRKTNREVDPNKLAALRTKMGAEPEQKVQPEVKTAASRWKSLKRSNLVAKKVESFSYQEILHQLEDEHMKKEYYLRGAPADITNCVVKTNVIDEIPFINNHVIIIGKGMNNLYDLIRPLRAKFLGMLRFIVIVTPDDIPLDVWARISIFDAILIVRGSALEEANLRRAGIFRCAQVVVLADGGGDTNSSVGMEALVDSDAIFSYQLVKRMNAGTQIVVEIVNTSNISYLESDGSSNEENYKFTPQFAAGNLFTTSLLDSIVCQAYYNPSIIKVLNRLISGVDHIEAAELAAEATAKVAAQSGDTKAAGADPQSDSDSGDSDTFDTNAVRLPKTSPKKGGPRQSIIGMTSAKVASTKRIKDIQGSCLYQMSIPDNFNEKTYGKLFQKLAFQGIIPLGILRGTFAGLSVGPRANRAPYVYTNPEKDVELFKCDKIFVLSTKAIQVDSKLDLKDWLLNMQQNKALRAAEASAKRPGSASAPHLDTLEISQKKLDARMTKLSKEMNHKLDGLMGMLNTMSKNPRGKSFFIEGEEDEGEYYTLDGNDDPQASAERVRRSSIDSSASEQQRVEYVGSGKTRRRVNSTETVSSTRVAPRMSMRQGSAASDRSDGSGGFSEKDTSPDNSKRVTYEPDNHNTDNKKAAGDANPFNKSRSLSKFAPSGILRKPSLTPDSAPVSQKKRHSFSTTLTTVHVITDPGASFTSQTDGDGGDGVTPGAGSGTGSGGANADSPHAHSEPNSTAAATAAVAVAATAATATAAAAAAVGGGGSPRTDSGSEGEQEDDENSLQSAEDVPSAGNGDGGQLLSPSTAASPSAIDIPTKRSDEEEEDKDKFLMQEETKQAFEDRDSPYSDSNTLIGSEKNSRDNLHLQNEEDEDSDLNAPFRNISRKKPNNLTKSPASSPFSPARKRADLVLDRATISGPPLELAMTAINNNRALERNRALSATTTRAEKRVQADRAQVDANRAFSAGFARPDL